ncbi:MAG: amidohydrolase family protein [Pseudomonadota bacterium]
MDALITNGNLVTPWEIITGVTIGIERGKISCIQRDTISSKAKEVIDARGNYIFPGIIDCHTHFGAFLSYEDDVITETKAAAAGGVTTVFHVILEQGSVFERIPYYIETTERLATVDMSFWAACMTENHLEEISKCYERGFRGFKFFMAYKGDEMKKVGISGIDLAYLFRGMENIKEAGGIAVVHAENYELLQLFRQRYSHRNDFPAFCRSRPPLCEETDADTACRMAEEIGVPLYIVHVGAGKVLDIVGEFRKRGNQVYIETSPRYLVINHDGTGIKQPKLALTTPAYKPPESLARLWEGIKGDEVDCIATDSSANRGKEKIGDGTLWKMQLSWQEMPTLLPMMVSEGFHKGRMTLNQLVKLTSYNPAKIFGLYPRKGTLQPGADADLIIVDVDKKQNVAAELFPSACDYTPYEGWELKGWPVLTMVRGEVVMEDGKVREASGWGKVVGIR